MDDQLTKTERKRYTENARCEKDITRCIHAQHMRTLVETCAGFLDDHESIMADKDARKLRIAVRAAMYALSRPITPKS